MFFLKKFIYISLLYIGFYPLTHLLIYNSKYDFSNKYNSFTFDRKLYILSNIIKSIFLFFISCNFFLLEANNNFTLDWESNSNEIKSLVISYVIPDFWSILITNRTMKINTLFHHTCVIIATLFIIYSDLSKPGVHISFIMYGLFSAYTFLVNYFLGARFIHKFSNKMINFTNLTYMVSCALNWDWQLYYTIYNFYFSFQWFIFITLLYFWINDDIILVKFLLNYKNSEFKI